MKLDVLVRNGIDVKVEKKRHARPGEIIVPSYCRRYEPMFVVRSYFEPRLIEKYGIDSEEILYHGTNYVDCFSLESGRYERLQYYEYRILKNSVRLRRKFVERWKDAAEVMEYLQEEQKDEAEKTDAEILRQKHRAARTKEISPAEGAGGEPGEAPGLPGGCRRERQEGIN